MRHIRSFRPDLKDKVYWLELADDVMVHSDALAKKDFAAMSDAPPMIDLPAFDWTDAPTLPPDTALFSLIPKGHWSVPILLEMERQKLLAASSFRATGVALPTSIAVSKRSGSTLYEPGRVVPEYYAFLDQLLGMAQLKDETASLDVRAQKMIRLLMYLQMVLTGYHEDRLFLSVNDPNLPGR